MRPEAFESVVVHSSPGELPYSATQSSGRWSGIVRLTTLSILAALVVGPQLALAAYALAEPATRALIVDRPLMAAELIVAMAFWIALFAWPIARLYDRINSRRTVEITRMMVAVRDEKLFKSEIWVAPLASYSGLSHRVRTSLSGSRHELLLVHQQRSKSILLLASEHIGETQIELFADLLGLPQIRNGKAYERTRSRPSTTTDQNSMKAAA